MTTASRVLSQIWINGQQWDAFSYSLTVTQTWGQHEVAEIEVNTATRTEDYSNLISKRIEFNWGSGANRIPFKGYIVDAGQVQRHQQNKPQTRFMVTAYGPSLIMKTGRPRFWSDTKTTDAIASIVADNMLGFSSEVLRDDVVWRQLAQTTESDWQMVNALARRLGTVVICDTGVVRLLDPSLVYSRYMPAKFFTSAGLGGDTLRMLDFKPTNLSMLDPNQQLPVVAYASAGGVTVRSPVTSDLPPVYSSRLRFSADMPMRTPEEARAIQQAYRNEVWNEEATARTMGDVTFKPGLNVYIRSQANPSSVKTPAYDGLWFIHKVVHMIDIGSYQCSFDLGRQAMRGHNNQAAAPFWSGDRRGKPELRVNGNGQWISTWR